jgi:hypothetical protein
MDRHILLTAELNVIADDEMPIYRFQQLSDFAQKRRSERIEAAQQGKIYTG